jgi:valyl-tRNA synthetase
MVNWCPASLTALSDEEVIMKPVNGTLYKVRYELRRRPGAVHPGGDHPARDDSRATSPSRSIPDDPRYAGPGRPQGLAPAQPRRDSDHRRRRGGPEVRLGRPQDHARPRQGRHEIGQRHGLPVLDILNADATLNALAGPELAGMERFAARKKAASSCAPPGALVGEEAYQNNVGYSERADVPIEPRLTWQWWLRYPRVEEAKAAVRDGQIRFHPERWSKVYLHWLDNIQDWCISRQLWWGHRIPSGTARASTATA